MSSLTRTHTIWLTVWTKFAYPEKGIWIVVWNHNHFHCSFQLRTPDLHCMKFLLCHTIDLLCWCEFLVIVGNGASKCRPCGKATCITDLRERLSKSGALSMRAVVIACFRSLKDISQSGVYLRFTYGLVSETHAGGSRDLFKEVNQHWGLTLLNDEVRLKRSTYGSK